MLKSVLGVCGMPDRGDPQDFLGRLIGDASWVRNAEMSMYDCYDDNFFATRFHIDLFTSTFER